MAVAISATSNGAQAAVSTTTSTYSAQSIGVAVDDRLVFVSAIQASFVSGPTISALSIAGISAAQVNAGVALSGGGYFWRNSIWWAAVPSASGTTANIVMTINSIAGADSTFTSFSAYRVTGSELADPVSSSSFTSDAGPTTSIGASLTIPEDGGAIGAATSGDVSGPTFSWTNLTENVDADIDFGTGLRRTTASSTTAGTATRTATLSASAANVTLALVAIRPLAAGHPVAKRMGGVKFVGNRAGQNTSLWRKSLGWRKSIGGLLLPSAPSIIRN